MISTCENELNLGLRDLCEKDSDLRRVQSKEGRELLKIKKVCGRVRWDPLLSLCYCH